MADSWTIGSAPGCDIVVAQPVVSGRHCKLTSDEDGFTLEDLRSTNGTFVNGIRLNGSTRVKRTDTITLGTSVPLPWPAPEATTAVLPAAGGTKVENALKILRIGREPDNDIAIANPVVSSRHARLIWDGVSDHVIVEDLGSSNGTAIGSPANRVQKAPLRASDTLYLGSLAVPAATLLGRFSPGLLEAPAGSAVPVPAVASSSAGLRIGILTGQVPILAGIIVAVCGSRLPAQLVCLGMAAIWCGMTDGLFLEERGGPAGFGRRLGVGLGLVVGQCIVMCLIVSGVSGFPGGSNLLGAAILSGVTGLGLGLLLGASIPSTTGRLASAVIALVALSLVGPFEPIDSAPSAMRPLIQLSPSRWALEAMLQSGAKASPKAAEALDAYFPAETERMGPGATFAAQFALAAGLIGGAFYVTWAGRASGRKPEPMGLLAGS